MYTYLFHLQMPLLINGINLNIDVTYILFIFTCYLKICLCDQFSLPDSSVLFAQGYIYIFHNFPNQ